MKDYTAVETNLAVVVDHGAEEESWRDDEEQANTSLPRTTPLRSLTSYSHCLLVLVALVIGFGLGWLLSGNSSSDTVSSSSSSCDVRPLPPSLPVASSYHFWKTSRGQVLWEQLSTLLTTQGPLVALTQLASMLLEEPPTGNANNNNNNNIRDACHPLAHRLGQQALATYHGWDNVWAYFQPLGTPQDDVLRTCNGAFLHGVLEHYLQAAANEAQLAARIQVVQTRVCRVLYRGAAVLDNTWECTHGVGHGVAQYYRRHATRRALQLGLQTCAAAAANNATTNHTLSASACQNGLWMDYFAAFSITDMMLNATAVVQVCLDADLYKYKNEKKNGGDVNNNNHIQGKPSPMDCIVYAPTAYLLQYPADYKGAMDFCVEALVHDRHHKNDDDNDNDNDDENSVRLNRNMLLSQCVGGVGAQIAKEHYYLHQLYQVEAICLAAAPPTTQLQGVCFASALSYYTTSMGTNTIPERFCDNLTTFAHECLQWTTHV